MAIPLLRASTFLLSTVNTVTLPPNFSFSLRPVSIAISSKKLVKYLFSISNSESDLTFTIASGSGTCFTNTKISILTSNKSELVRSEALGERRKPTYDWRPALSRIANLYSKSFPDSHTELHGCRHHRVGIWHLSRIVEQGIHCRRRFHHKSSWPPQLHTYTSLWNDTWPTYIH